MTRVERAICSVLTLFFVGIVCVMFIVPTHGWKPRFAANAEMAEEVEEAASEPEVASEEDIEYFSDEEILDYLNTYANPGGNWKLEDEAYFVFYADDDLGSALALLYSYPNDQGLLDGYHKLIDGMKSYTKYVDNAYGKKCRLAMANPLNYDLTMAEFQEEEIIYDAFAE